MNKPTIREVLKPKYCIYEDKMDCKICSALCGLAQALAEIEGIVEEGFKDSKLYQMQFLLARGVGHTKTLLDGVKNNPDAILIVANEQQKRSIKDLQNRQMISVSTLPDGLRGLRKPIVIDHAALMVLIDEALHAMLKERVK